MIAGGGGDATRVLTAATNSEGSPFMYVMDPREQLRIMDDIEDSGEELLAIYHSHTRSAAYPSRTDVELAFFPDTLYLIVSIADRDAPEIRAFRISRGAPEGEQIAEEPVEIIDARPRRAGPGVAPSARGLRAGSASAAPSRRSDGLPPGPVPRRLRRGSRLGGVRRLGSAGASSSPVTASAVASAWRAPPSCGCAAWARGRSSSRRSRRARPSCRAAWAPASSRRRAASALGGLLGLAPAAGRRRPRRRPRLARRHRSAAVVRRRGSASPRPAPRLAPRPPPRRRRAAPHPPPGRRRLLGRLVDGGLRRGGRVGHRRRRALDGDGLASAVSATAPATTVLARGHLRRPSRGDLRGDLGDRLRDRRGRGLLDRLQVGDGRLGLGDGRAAAPAARAARGRLARSPTSLASARLGHVLADLRRGAHHDHVLVRDRLVERRQRAQVEVGRRLDDDLEDLGPLDDLAPRPPRPRVRAARSGGRPGAGAGGPRRRRRRARRRRPATAAGGAARGRRASSTR